MASGESVALRESIRLPILIVALGGALAGGSYGLALLESDVIFHTLPVFGGLVMGIAVSLALVRAGVKLRPSHSLSLLVIWALGSGTILPLLSLLGSSANVLAVQVAVLIPVIAGGLTGWATRRTIERAVGFRLKGVSLSVTWAAGFTMFVLGCFFFSAFLLFVRVDLMPNSAVWLPITGLCSGGLAAGCSAWLMLRDLESALRRHSSVKSRNTLEAGEHGALEVVSAPDEKLKGKPKAKRRVDVPVPETPRQWRMVALAGLLVFTLAAVFFAIFPVRTVTVFVTPPPMPTIVPFPTSPPIPQQMTQMIFPPPTQPLPEFDPQPLYYIGQKVQVANLTPDVANYVDWWVNDYWWLPEEREWIYEVVTFDNISIMRAENQLAPLMTLTPSPPPLPTFTPTIPIQLT